MRTVAIVGAGQAGLLAAHALLKHGYEVTLFSDKTPEDFLTKARPTGSAARFDMALEFERELGLEMWGDEAPRGEGVHLTFCPEKGNQLLTLLGRLEKYFLAIDVRLQSATWMDELEKRGGRVEIENVSVERLDAIAAEYDLTIVAAGRGPVRKLFARDDERSSYTTPQRFLAMICVVGPSMSFPYAPYYTPVRFNLFAPEGECFWVPWYSKDKQPSWSLLFEAKEGGAFDRFRDIETPQAMLARSKEVIADMCPWDSEWVAKAELCDEHSWLLGAVTPEVRRVAGKLPSGRHVMALGDTAQSLDPIAGQGANNGNKMARSFVESIVEHGDRPFDETWMTQTFDRFWERHRYIDMFNNTLLEPLTPAGQILLMAQYGSDAKPGNTSPQQKVANAFMGNFVDPKLRTEAFHDPEKAKKIVEDAFGSSAWPVLKGKARIAKAQLRQKLGLSAAHPGM